MLQLTETQGLLKKKKHSRMLLCLKRFTIILVQHPPDDMYRIKKTFPCKPYTCLPLYDLLNKRPDVYGASEAEIPLEPEIANLIYEKNSF